ncbi:response regulator [Pseudolysobacter antarcticus]|nr:response regulator [Pseudolysobacter antarcticus]
MRVLIVEDDALVAAAIRSGPTASGFAVDHVGSAEATRTALRHENFDLIEFDLVLPAADGFSLAQRLRAGGLTLPAVILTARDASADRVRGLGYRLEETEK